MDGHSPRTNTSWIDAPLSRDQRAVTEPAPISRRAQDLDDALARLGDAIAEADPGALRRASELLAKHPVNTDLQTIAARIGDARMLVLLVTIWAKANEDSSKLILHLFLQKDPEPALDNSFLDELARRQLLDPHVQRLPRHGAVRSLPIRRFATTRRARMNRFRSLIIALSLAAFVPISPPPRRPTRERWMRDAHPVRRERGDRARKRGRHG